MTQKLFNRQKHDNFLRRAYRTGYNIELLECIYKEFMDRLVDRMPETLQLLDLYTPMGYTTQKLSQTGKLAYGAQVVPFVDEKRRVLDKDLLSVCAASEYLPFESHSFNIVTSFLSLQNLEHPELTLKEIQRCSKKDSIVCCAFIGGESLREFRSVFRRAELKHEDNVSMRFFPMIDVRTAGQIFQHTGFKNIVVDHIYQELLYKDLHAILKDIRSTGLMNCLSYSNSTPKINRKTYLELSETYKALWSKNERLLLSLDVIWVLASV